MKLIHLPDHSDWDKLGLLTTYQGLTNLALVSMGAAGKRHAAYVKRGSEILGSGVNSYKTSPLQKRFAADEHHIYLHAEIEALSRSSRRSLGDLEGTTCCVVRINRKMEAASSKPCTGCMRALLSFGVKEVYYT